MFHVLPCIISIRVDRKLQSLIRDGRVTIPQSVQNQTNSAKTAVYTRTMERRNHLTKLARKLRKDQTDAEQRLWTLLRNRRLQGWKFRRQRPLGPYIVDFVSFAGKLIVELDGGQHNSPEGKLADLQRTEYFVERGYTILRVWNHEVFQDEEAVLEAICRKLK